MLPFQGGIRNVCITLEDFQHLNWCWYFVCKVWGYRYGSHTKQFISPNPPDGRSTRFCHIRASDWQEALRSTCITSVSVMIVLITTALVSIAIRLQTGWSGIQFLRGVKIFLISKMSRPALGPTQLFHWVYNSCGIRLAAHLHVWLKWSYTSPYHMSS